MPCFERHQSQEHNEQAGRSFADLKQLLGVIQGLEMFRISARNSTQTSEATAEEEEEEEEAEEEEEEVARLSKSWKRTFLGDL